MKFSSLVKNNNIFTNKLFTKVKNINENINDQKEENTKVYSKELHKDLLCTFLQCELSIPSIIINFKKEEELNFKKMEDLADYKERRNKKINFIVFPPLISNRVFSKKGNNKYLHILMIRKKTFNLENINLVALVEEYKKFNR